MANSTLAAVPIDLQDLSSLKRFLLRIVEKVDVLEGNRGNNPAITSNTFSTYVEDSKQVQEAVIEDIVSLNEQLAKLIEDLQRLEDLDFVLSSPFGVLTSISDITGSE